MISFSLLAPYLYYLLAPVLFIYWMLLKPQHRPFFLTLLSCGLLAAAAPVFFVYVIFSAFLISRINYLSSATKVTIFGFLFGALTILSWKYILQYFGDTASQFSSFETMFATIGVSYMGLRITALIVSLQNQEVKNVSFLDCLNFLSFFPTIAAGPLESITGFQKGYSMKFNPQLFWVSIYRLVLGLFKKLFVLEILFKDHFHEEIAQFVFVNGIEASAFSSGEIFVLCMLLFLKALLDISAYTDLALGFAGLFGYRIINDLNYPLIVRDLSEFWRSWHISVMRWCQTHVYFPVFFWKKNITLATFASLTVMGIWHSAELKWLVWGLYEALGLSILHKWNQFKSARNYPASLFMKCFHICSGTFLTFLFASFAFLLMGPENFSRSYDLLRAFLGIN
jgi:alginate O-acetyltransferase complex protein AlgI